MTTKGIKAKIKKKFGSLTKFATLAKLDRYQLQKFFAAAEKNMTPERKAYILELDKIANATKVEATKYELSESIRQMISDKLHEMGGVKKFCTEHPGFSEVSIFQVINGTRKRITDKVQSLIKILNIQS